MHGVGVSDLACPLLGWELCGQWGHLHLLQDNLCLSRKATASGSAWDEKGKVVNSQIP